jgi:hypothetical protein
LNQLITFDNFYETRNFIEEMVKPDYNNWEGKDDYARTIHGYHRKIPLNKFRTENKTRSLCRQRHFI